MRTRMTAISSATAAIGFIVGAALVLGYFTVAADAASPVRDGLALLAFLSAAASALGTFGAVFGAPSPGAATHRR
jgi:hypothetical protein